jgi:hypothetical protein
MQQKIISFTPRSFTPRAAKSEPGRDVIILENETARITARVSESKVIAFRVEPGPNSKGTQPFISKSIHELMEHLRDWGTVEEKKGFVWNLVRHRASAAANASFLVAEGKLMEVPYSIQATETAGRAVSFTVKLGANPPQAFDTFGEVVLFIGL